MMKTWKLLILAIAVLSAGALSALADTVVYNQIGSELSGNWGGSWNTYYQVLKDPLSGMPSTYDERLVDDFMLSTDSTINLVTVSGTMTGNAALTGVNVYLYANNNGAPGTLLQSVSGTNLTTRENDVSKQYSIDVSANPLTVSANTTYWLSVQPVFAEGWSYDNESRFSWNVANDAAIPSSYTSKGAGTVEMSYGANGSQWGRYLIIGDGIVTLTHWEVEPYSGSLPSGWQAMDLSFSLSGTGGGGSTIPEPGTLAMLATGLIGLLVYAWRNRK